MVKTLASSCGNTPFNKPLPKGIGINKNIVTRNVHPVTTPKDSGLETVKIKNKIRTKSKSFTLYHWLFCSYQFQIG